MNRIDAFLQKQNPHAAEEQVKALKLALALEMSAIVEARKRCITSIGQTSLEKLIVWQESQPYALVEANVKILEQNILPLKNLSDQTLLVEEDSKKLQERMRQLKEFLS